MTLTQLRQYASDNNIQIIGDKRLKQSYIDSITAHKQSHSIQLAIMLLPLMVVAILIIGVGKATAVAICWTIASIIWLWNSSDVLYVELTNWATYLFGDEDELTTG